jgi:predicted MFS family arabinose efflux permease
MARSLRLSLSARYPRDVWLLCASTSLGASAFLGLRQLLNALYLLRLGLGVDSIGAMSAVGAISFSLSSLPGGALGTRKGPLRVMLLGALVNMVGMALLPMTEMLPDTMRFSWVLLSQMVSSAGWSFFSVNAVAVMAGLTTPTNRRGAYALSEAFYGMGSFSGTLLGGLLPGVFAVLLGTTTEFALPYRYALWGAMIPVMVGLVPLILLIRHDKLVPVDTGAERSLGRFRIGLPLVLLVSVVFFNNGAYAACRVFSSAYLDTIYRLPTSLIGIISSFAMLLAAVIALSSQRISRGHSSGWTMALASLGVGVSLLTMAVVPHWVGGALGMLGVYSLLSLWRPSFQALQMEIADPAWRSLVSGATAMTMSMGFGSVSYSGGLVVERLGYRAEFLLGAGLAGISALIAIMLQRRLRRMAEGPTIGAGDAKEPQPCPSSACVTVK